MKILEIQKVPASHGLLWIKHGVTLIMRSPLQAVSLSLMFALGIFMALLVPVVGVFLAILLMPLMMAGYMRVCRSLEYSEKVDPRMIFAGFNLRTPQLATLGGMLLMGMILISMFTAAVGGSELSELLKNFQIHQDATKFINTLLAPESGLRLTLLMSFALFFVLMLAMQFAPMLVFFNQLSPKDALLVSLRSSIRNILPFSVYSLLIQLIAFFLSVIPFELGLLVLLPLGMTSMYVAYRDIFNEQDSTEPGKVESTARTEE
jgi:uncharacterized membrane protein